MGVNHVNSPIQIKIRTHDLKSYGGNLFRFHNGTDLGERNYTVHFADGASDDEPCIDSYLRDAARILALAGKVDVSMAAPKSSPRPNREVAAHGATPTNQTLAMVMRKVGLEKNFARQGEDLIPPEQTGTKIRDKRQKVKLLRTICIFLGALVRDTYGEGSPNTLYQLTSAASGENATETLLRIYESLRALYLQAFGLAATDEEGKFLTVARSSALLEADITKNALNARPTTVEMGINKAGNTLPDKRVVILQTATGLINIHALPSLLGGARSGGIFLTSHLGRDGAGERADKTVRKWRKMGYAELVFRVEGPDIRAKDILGFLTECGLLKKITDIDHGRVGVAPSGGCVRVSEWAIGQNDMIISSRGDAVDARPPQIMGIFRRYL